MRIKRSDGVFIYHIIWTIEGLLLCFDESVSELKASENIFTSLAIGDAVRLFSDTPLHCIIHTGKLSKTEK